MPSITVCMPTLGLIHYRTVLSMISLLGANAGNQIEMFIVPRVPVHEARNLGCKDLKTDYVFFLDDDMIVPPDALARLLSRGREVVGALAFRRVAPFSPCIFTYTGPGDPQRAPGYYPITHVNGARIDLARGLLPVAAIGMSCTLIHRSVFQRLTYPFFSYGELSEDLSFCQRLNEASIPIFCDLDLRIGHLTEEIVTADQFSRHFPERIG